MNLDAGLLLVVFRPADWPWGPRAGVSATEDRLLLVGTKRRGPKQSIKPLPEDLCDDGPPLYANVPPFVLHEGAVRNAPPYLVPLSALDEKLEVLFRGNYAGALDEPAATRRDEDRLSDLVDHVFFKGEQRFLHLYAIRDSIVRLS